MREDPKKKGMLYAGTERGVVFSADDGKTWQSLQLNLPTVPVHDLIVKGDDLVVGTHGRSLWIFDDLTPIRSFGAGDREQAGRRAAPAAGHTLAVSMGRSAPWRRGDNPPAGAVIHLWLKDKPKARPKLEILDADGKLVRSLGRTDRARADRRGERRCGRQGAGRRGAGGQGEGAEEEEPRKRPTPRRPQEAEAARQAGPAPRGLGPGARPARPIKDARIDAGSAETGPLALPGKYTVKLTVDGQTATAPLEISPDPRVKVPAAELAEQVRLGLAVRDDFNKLSGAVERLRAIRKQLQARNALLKDIDQAKPLAKTSTGSDGQARRAGGQAAQPQGPGHLRHPGHEGRRPALFQPRLALRLGARRRRPPHPGHARGRRAVERRAGRPARASFRPCIDKDLAELNRQAKALDMPHIIVPPVKPDP